MQGISVERTFCNLLHVYGRSSSRTAHRLRLRSSPRTLTPSFLLSEKSHAASLLLACKRALVVTDCASLAAAFLAANAHSVVPPLVKKSRSVRLFAYKCAHNASLSLPTFCRFRRSGVVPFRLLGTHTSSEQRPLSSVPRGNA